jgi:hypothetical protein
MSLKLWKIINISKHQQDSRLSRQQRLKQTKSSSRSTSRSASPAVQHVLVTISERTETTSTEESQQKICSRLEYSDNIITSTTLSSAKDGRR